MNKEFLFKLFLKQNLDRIHSGHMNDVQMMRCAFYAGLEMNHVLSRKTFDDIERFDLAIMHIKDNNDSAMTVFEYEDWIPWLESQLKACPVCGDSLKIYLQEDWPDCDKQPSYTLNISCENNDCLFDIDLDLEDWKKLKLLIE